MPQVEARLHEVRLADVRLSSLIAGLQERIPAVEADPVRHRVMTTKFAKIDKRVHSRLIHAAREADRLPSRRDRDETRLRALRDEVWDATVVLQAALAECDVYEVDEVAQMARHLGWLAMTTVSGLDRRLDRRNPDADSPDHANKETRTGRPRAWSPRIVEAVEGIVDAVTPAFGDSLDYGGRGQAEEYAGLLCVLCGLLPLTDNVGEVVRKRIKRA